MNFEDTLEKLALHLAAKAMADNCDIQDTIKATEVLLKYCDAVLTRDGDQGDNTNGRRPTTISDMRKQIALVSDRGDEDEPSAG